MTETISVKDGESTLSRIRYRTAPYRPIEARIAAAIIEDPDRFTRESIIVFAQRTVVSTGSVVRFAKLLGFPGFSDLKLAIARELPANRATGAPEGSMGGFQQRIDAQLRAMIVASRISPVIITGAARALARARHVELVATGSSSSIAHSMGFSVNVVGVYARHLPDSSEHAGAAALLGNEDVLVAVSFSGRTKGTVDAAARARESGATIISLTCSRKSPLLELTDISIVLDTRGGGSDEWPLRTALFAVARALTLEVADQLRPAELQRRRARWSSGRFGIRYGPPAHS